MQPFLSSFRKFIAGHILAFTGLAFAISGILLSSSAHGNPSANLPSPAPDVSVFQKPMASDQLAFLTSFDGHSSKDAVKDGKFHKIIHTIVPDAPYHYHRDLPLSEVLETVITGVPLPVEIRDGRYAMVSGQTEPNGGGLGFLWTDMHDGIALGGISFHPTNGEPTPTLTIFSKQVKEESLELGQLPVAFAQDMYAWSARTGIPPVLTRYFINDSGMKIVLEHDEDYCAHPDGAPAPPADVCEQMNSDAADIDMQAAYFMERTGYASNATARTAVESDQGAWIVLRDNTCREGPDRLKCRIRMTHERTHVLLSRRHAGGPPPVHSPHK
jgi:uncharacterized protein YecT (DUF1311 family)